MAQTVDESDVRENLSFLEKVTAHFSSSDDYKAAILNNQRVQTRILSQLVGTGMSQQVDPTNVDMDSLPDGLVGTSEDSIEKGDTGRAIFDIGGSKYEARVRAEGDIEKSETVVIHGDSNKVRPADNATNALSSMVGAGEGGRNAVISPDDIGIYETSDLDHANDLGSVVLDPGDKKVIASTDDITFGGYLLGAGAYNEADVEYSIRVDGEIGVGGWTNSPLGTINDPFWFADGMGGVIRFAERVDYMARYDESSTGQVELTARLHSQNL